MIYAEHPREVELALDEIELDWSGQPNAKVDVPAQRAIGIAGAQVVDRSDVRARIALAANTLADLAQLAASLEAANPGLRRMRSCTNPARRRRSRRRRYSRKRLACCSNQRRTFRPSSSAFPSTRYDPSLASPAAMW